MSLISSIEHAFAVGAQKLVEESKTILTKVIPALQKLEATESTVESITALVSPHAVNIERSAYAILGLAIKAADAAGQAGAAGGVNLALDSALVAELKALIPAIKAVAPKVGQ